MVRCSKMQQIFVCCLCVILALVCAFSFLLPHLHACDGKQCAVCALLADRERLWLPSIVLITTVTVIVYARETIAATKNCDQNSLVRLKVKLSN